MARKISISFKKTTKDMELYDLLNSMEDKSYEIKQLIRKALQNTDSTPKETKKEDVNILDF